MNAKKGKRTAIWEMLFVYFAISKAIYWVNFVIVAFLQGDIRSVGEAVLMRLLNQDILIIGGILVVYCVEKLFEKNMSKYKKVWVRIIEYFVIYLVMQGVSIAYHWGISLLLGRSFNWNLGTNFIYGGILFFAISLMLEIKYYLKKKEKTEYTPVLSEEEKLSMIKTLLDNNVLTQDEYDSKKKLFDVY